jgi:hypothetical protein
LESNKFIQRDDLKIPSPLEFISIFGCDVEFDENTYTESYIFADNYQNILKIYVNKIEKTFRMLITIKNHEIVNVFGENLHSIEIDQENHYIKIIMNEEISNQSIILAMFPKFKMSMDIVQSNDRR